MDLDSRAVKIVEEAEALSQKDLRGALAKMRKALAIEPDYPHLEDEIFIREDAIAKLDGVLGFIVVLLREGKDYQGCQMLRGLPGNYIIQDKSGLVGGLEAKIAKVEGLIAQARDLAKTGNAEALAIIEEAFMLVPDYPGISEEMAAIKQEFALYNSQIKDLEKVLQGKKGEKAAALLRKFREAYPDDENVRRFEVAITNLGKDLKKKKYKQIHLLKIIAAVGGFFALVGVYFSYEMVMINKAGRQWAEVSKFLAAQKFTETQAACREIDQNLGKVRLFFLDTRRDLQGKVDNVLQSEVVVKGAEGKVLFDGDYISKEMLANSQMIKRNIEEAKLQAAQGNYAEAIRRFEEARSATAGGDEKTAAEVVADINLSITRCRLGILGEIAAKSGALLATGSHYAALAGINDALAMVKKYSLDPGEPVVVKTFAIQRNIVQTKLKELIAGGDKLFIAGSYDNAVNSYNRAKAFARDNGLGSDSLDWQIDGMINRSKVKDVMIKGDRYFAASRWREAAQAYERGITLALETDMQNMPSFQLAQINLQKANKMQAVAHLSQLNKMAGQHFKANEIEKARNLFLQAIKTAEGNEWHGDKEIVAILAELKSGLAEVEEVIFIDTAKKFLLDRYNAILKKDFGLRGDAALLDPAVVLLTATPELLKFTVSAMSYTKKGTVGNYSRYEGTYAFDRKNESWRLLDKTSDSKETTDSRYN